MMKMDGLAGFTAIIEAEVDSAQRRGGWGSPSRW